MLFLVVSFFSVCLYFFLLVVFSVFVLRCVCSKTSVPCGFFEEKAYSLLLDVVVVCLLLLFSSFGLVVCLHIVPCSAKYFCFFMFSASCCFPCFLACSVFPYVFLCSFGCFLSFFVFFPCSFCDFFSGRGGGGKKTTSFPLFLGSLGFSSCFSLFFWLLFGRRNQKSVKIQPSQHQKTMKNP